jgi:hypothetical protein
VAGALVADTTPGYAASRVGNRLGG